MQSMEHPQPQEDDAAEHSFYEPYDSIRAYQFLAKTGIGNIIHPKLVDDSIIDSPTKWSRPE